jgi:hypothetical protein
LENFISREKNKQKITDNNAKQQEQTYLEEVIFEKKDNYQRP